MNFKLLYTLKELLSSKMSTIRAMRPIASRFSKQTLPVIRSYSASSYEFIETSEPRPGVGQSTSSFSPSSPLQTQLTIPSNAQPPQSSQRPLHPSNHRTQPGPPLLRPIPHNPYNSPNRLAKSLRRRRRYQRNGTPNVLRSLHNLFHRILVLSHHQRKKTHHRRRLRSRLRWRLRVGLDVRYPVLYRKREFRAAGD